MVTKLVTSDRERFREAVERELAASMKREDEFNAQERKDRAARLGLDLNQLKLSSH